MKTQIILAFLLVNTLLSSGQNVSLVDDLRNGELGSQPNELNVYKGKLYFTATDGIDFYALWEYNGQEQPTKLLSDGFDGFNTRDFCTYQDKLFFAKGKELWSYNGLSSPTKATDISNGEGVSNLIVFHDTLFFNSSHDTFGNEIFHYNGLGDAKLFYDIVEGVTSSTPSNFTIYNDALYFCPISGKNDLWAYIGDSVLKINGTDGINPDNLFVYNNELFFSANIKSDRELWKYNSLTDELVNFDLNPDSTEIYDPFEDIYFYILNSSDPGDFCIFNETLFFTAIDSNDNRNLWYFSNNNPVIANHISNGKHSFGNLTNINTSLYFTCNDSVHGEELWYYDGHDKPNLITDIVVGAGSSQPMNITGYNNKVYFTADDHNIYGRELWVYDPIISSITNIIKEKVFSVYPNPTNHSINISINDESSLSDIIVKLYDSTGKMCFQQIISGISNEIIVSHLKNGIYFIQLHANNKNYVEKLVVK